MTIKETVVLASGSPRRRELLTQLGYSFDILIPHIEEIPKIDESPQQYVSRLSKEKAFAAQKQLLQAQGCAKGILFIGADTIVVFQQQVLEKPKDLTDSIRILSLLSGQCHQVMTSVTVVKNNQFNTMLVTTDVWFKPLTIEEITKYWYSGEPQDKAGSYAIQGTGGRFVTRIEGSYHAVVGLPLFETEQLLEEFL